MHSMTDPTTAAHGSPLNLFPGDSGELPLDTRRVLVNLLRGPTLDGQRQPNLWKTLVRDEAILRARLNDLFLTLVLDRDQLVAFTQQADVAELDAPTLLRRTPLTFIETALLLHLRAQLARADAQGERCVLEAGDLLGHLHVYAPADQSDLVKFDRHGQAAVEKAVKLGVLSRLRGSDTRYEVSQALRLMFSVEDIEALTELYQGLAATTAALTDAVDGNDQSVSEDI